MVHVIRDEKKKDGASEDHSKSELTDEDYMYTGGRRGSVFELISK
jgi:hypothetical protein